MERTNCGRTGLDHKWIVLLCTTLGVLLAVINSSSLLIALPDIFRGIHLDPLNSSNFAYLLWILMGYGMVVAALVVTAGRIGDMYGRVRIFKIGLILFTVTAVLLTLIWSTGPTAALEIVILRMVQAIGGAMLMANSAAILTDAFPHNQRGLALGIYGLGLLAGSFVGLILGGVLATVYWRLVFAVNVPIGLIAIVFAFWKLHDFGERHPARIDWPGNILFASALGMILTGVTYGIKPYHGANVGWANPFVLTVISIGVVLLAAFFFIETRVKDPMFNLKLFRIRAFAAGNLAVVLSSVANGGMQFLLIMWLQGIWLPLHGYSFEKTPLWAGIFMLPLTLGYLCAAPISGGSVRSLRGPAFCHSRDGAGVYQLPASADGTGRLHLLDVRTRHFHQRFGLRPVLLPQYRRDHEQCSRAQSRSRIWHASHLPDARPTAIYRHLLFAHGRGACVQGTGGHDRRSNGSSGPRRNSHTARPSATDRIPVRRLLGIQPHPAALGPESP